MSEEKAAKFDKNIKKIADDSNLESINKYVADELQGKKARRYSFPINQSTLAEKYDENNRKWMSHENLCCYFALQISNISMLLVLVEKYYKNDAWTSDPVQVVLYGSSFLFFKLVETKGWVYKDKRFNKFLEILNRNAPLLIILCTTVFYALACIEIKTNFIYLLMFLLAITPSAAIIKTLFQMPPKE